MLIDISVFTEMNQHRTVTFHSVKIRPSLVKDVINSQKGWAPNNEY
jgi:hypothetical protein